MNRISLFRIASCMILICSIGFTASCKSDQKEEMRQITKTEWLQGEWINESPYGNLSENWQKENDSLYRGESFFIKGEDTVHSETIVLAERNGEVLYSPTVQGQNGNKAVDFKMISATDKQLVFENPDHDFPRKIVYNKITKDSIVAEISGMQQGKPASEKFAMGRK